MDLEPLTQDLRRCFRFDPPRGYTRGKERVSRVLQRFFDCSETRADRIVSRLEHEGYLYSTSRGRSARWRFDPFPVIVDERSPCTRS